MNILLIMFCASNAGKRLFSFAGQIFNIMMIAIPIIIILIGSIDFIKAVIAQKDDEMKKSLNIFIKRLIIGVVVFFVPPIVNFVIGLTGISTSSPCMTCFTMPNDISCKTVQTNEFEIPVENLELNSSKCKNSIDKNLCCKENNGPNDADGIWVWNDDIGCKNTTAANPD